MKNFFEHQAAARTRTRWLVAYYIAAVIGTVIFTYLLVVAIFAYPAVKEGKPYELWNPFLLVLVVGATLLLVGGCTGYKVVQLSSGGQAVALMMGGRELVGQTRDATEKRLLNVVEEMAIASGVPVPPVYVLDEEEGINAFAAGYAPGEAVVAVSRGCLKYLNRDELQGVVAHEFSHILNGDMRLNIRLIALVFGIMGLATVGAMLLRTGGGSRRSKNAGQIVLLGIGLYLIGIVGAFFGNLIKAAVSRQREYLADASAVQFTRNPDGIGGALRKIGGLEKGPNIDNPNAPEAAHMFFADALRAARFTNMFATHPPLDDRIRRVDPNWDGTYPKVRPVAAALEEEQKPRKKKPPLAGMPTLPGLPQVPLPVLVADEAVGRVGTVTPDQAEYAAGLLEGLPSALGEAAREPFSVRALVYALLLDAAPEVRERQVAGLRAEAEARDFDETMRLAPQAAELAHAVRLPLVDLAMPALRRMSPGQYEVFRKQIEQLTAADRCVSLFEYVLRCVLERHLDASFGYAVALPAGPTLGGLTENAAVVLSKLAWEGHEDEPAARRAYEAGMKRYQTGAMPAMTARAECDLGRLDERLRRFAAAPLAARQRLLVACAACITADRKITVREAELYRAIGDVLGCPIPPLGAER